MTTYLTGGWYQPGPDKSLRTEVIDGAMDAAGLLHRAGIRADTVAYLALKVRSLFDPQTYAGVLSPEKRASIARRLGDASGDSPELYSFLSDCLEHVSGSSDLLAFYLHLVHVSRMLQLLNVARLGTPTLTVAKPVVAKKPVLKKPAAKKAAPKKASAKPKTKVKAKPKTKLKAKLARPAAKAKAKPKTKARAKPKKRPTRH